MLIPYVLFLIETNSRVGIISFVVLFIVYALKRFRPKNAITIVLSTILILILVSTKFNYLGSKMAKLIDSTGSTV